MQNINLQDFDKKVKFINQKRAMLDRIIKKISDLELNYQKELKTYH